MTFDPKEARALVKRLDSYTRGPWTWETESGEWPDRQIIGADGDSVLWWDFDLGFRTACDGCAHLIAAAPDLHRLLTAALDENAILRTEKHADAEAIGALREALSELADCVDDGCYCSEMKMATAVDEAREALKGTNQ